MADRPIDASFWSGPDWKNDLENAAVPGFAFFTDESIQYAVTRASRCEMDVIHRTSKEFFSKTVERSCAAAPPSAAINSSFGDSVNIGAVDYVSPAALEPDRLELMGDVVIERTKLGISVARDKRAFIAYDVESAPVSRKYHFGLGAPPADARAALGGLGPVILGGRGFSANKSDSNFHAFYMDHANLRASSGKVLVATSPKEDLLLLMVQPHGSSKRPLLKLDAIRDKLLSAGTRNAVFLDGSDSVMLFIAGDWKVRQGNDEGSYKDRVTSLGLRFHFQPEQFHPRAQPA